MNEKQQWDDEDGLKFENEYLHLINDLFHASGIIIDDENWDIKQFNFLQKLKSIPSFNWQRFIDFFSLSNNKFQTKHDIKINKNKFKKRKIADNILFMGIYHLLVNEDLDLAKLEADGLVFKVLFRRSSKFRKYVGITNGSMDMPARDRVEDFLEIRIDPEFMSPGEMRIKLHDEVIDSGVLFEIRSVVEKEPLLNALQMVIKLELKYLFQMANSYSKTFVEAISPNSEG